MEKHVVVIYAHPDDESFGAAGTIINFRKQEVPVTYLCGTLGEMGRNMGSPIFANRETLPKIREQELYDACKYLDINVRLLGYRDKTIEYEDRHEVAHHIKGILEDIKPSLVITHYPDYAVHPDHNALGSGVIEAVRLMNQDERPTVWAQAIEKDYPDVLGEPDIVHDISSIFDQKLTSILKHKSQAEGMLESINGTLQVTDEVKSQLKQRLGKEQFYIWSFD
ncbi:MAG TPA: bacillithiol biosynthesis deacetylase BshB2 [Virgibacillus sp.]|nr:bacillithiol biosynthesis deacetylase BshB2 [Virgibacillus sp.]